MKIYGFGMLWDTVSFFFSFSYPWSRKGIYAGTHSYTDRKNKKVGRCGIRFIVIPFYVFFLEKRKNFKENFFISILAS